MGPAQSPARHWHHCQWPGDITLGQSVILPLLAQGSHSLLADLRTSQGTGNGNDHDDLLVPWAGESRANPEYAGPGPSTSRSWPCPASAISGRLQVNMPVNTETHAPPASPLLRLRLVNSPLPATASHLAAAWQTRNFASGSTWRKQRKQAGSCHLSHDSVQSSSAERMLRLRPRFAGPGPAGPGIIIGCSDESFDS